jgi:5-deoxy-glucuronate isomerase
MYIDKKVVRGYNEYVNIDVNNGEGSWMDVGLLIIEKGDSFIFGDKKKEVSWILLSGDASVTYSGGTVRMYRPDPFDHKPYCILLSVGDSCSVSAQSHCEFYVQKTYNDRTFPTHLYTPEEIDTWRRGSDGELDNCIKRDVRTCYDYDNAPYSNMVLGEVVNLPGKWSSYPPHAHPQPEVYFYHFEKPQGFGAGWVDGKIHELHHNGCAVITEGTHSQVMAPGYACCYVWGIRHLPNNSWKKTRIDDPLHTWMLDPKARYWNGEK